jgi:hypothetical protein
MGGDSGTIEADFQLAGGSSVLFDAVFLALDKKGAQELLKEAAAVVWVHKCVRTLQGDWRQRRRQASAGRRGGGSRSRDIDQLWNCMSEHAYSGDQCPARAVAPVYVSSS